MTTQILDLRPARVVQGAVPVPGDKSISHRYVMLGSLAEGTTSVAHLAPGADVAATIACFEGLGVRIENDVLIGKKSNLDLMADIPIEADEIEELMNAGR